MKKLIITTAILVIILTGCSNNNTNIINEDKNYEDRKNAITKLKEKQKEERKEKEMLEEHKQQITDEKESKENKLCSSIDEVIEIGILDDENYRNMCKGDKNIRYVNFVSNIEALEDVAKIIYGEFSQELLLNKGVGVRITKGWKNIAYNYNTFLCTLTSEEKDELAKFIAFSLPNLQNEKSREEWIRKVISSINPISVADVPDFWLNRKKEDNKEVLNFNSFSFIEMVFNKTSNYSKKEANKFFELIVKEEYREAIDYIRNINNQKGTTEIFKKIKSTCRTTLNNKEYQEEMRKARRVIEKSNLSQERKDFFLK